MLLPLSAIRLPAVAGNHTHLRAVLGVQVSYTYDANGNLTVEPLAPPNNIGYDTENRLTSFSGGGGSGTYVYDDNSNRVQKTANGTTTVYIYSGDEDIAEYDNGAAPSSPSREYLYANGGSAGQLLAMVSGSTINYYHQDHLSVRLTTDVNGNNIGEQGHYPFGESWYQVNATTKWMFTSYQRDSESGLDYAMARFYNSRMGGFCSADPVEGSPDDPQSWNRYAYARNNPINITDPSGKSWWGALLDILAVALAVVLPEADPALFSFFGTSITVAGLTYGSTTSGISALGNFFVATNATVTTTSTVGLSLAVGAAGTIAGQATQQKLPTPKPQPQAKKDCPPVPAHPKGADVDANIRAMEAENVGTAVANQPHATAWNWFVSQVKPKGPWDYKAQPGGYPQWDDFGNFNFGATGSVLFNEKTLEFGAAIVRYSVRNPINNLRSYGSPFKAPNYGNDPHKNEMIRQGVKYQQNHCGTF